MRCTAIRTHICHAYRTNWVFVEVETDSGLVGVGEATLEYREQTVAEACRELIRILRGRDPHDVESFWHDAYRDTYFRGGEVLMTALSAVDMALWDIKGKDLGVPCWKLLGGRCRDRVPMYANGWFAPAKTPDEFAAKARAAVDTGFRALKWDPFGSAWLDLPPAAMDAAMACVGAVKDAVRGRAEILIEGHGRFNVPTAVRVGQELAQFKPLWFEEPLPPENLPGLADVKRRSTVPIAAGERLYNRWQFRDLLALGAVDYLQPDVSHAGGLSELRKIAAMAECHHLPVCPHNPSGPVANAATLQLAACLPNFLWLETMSADVPWRSEITDEAITVADGCMLIPDRPGLGIALNHAAIARHPYEPRDLRHFRGDLTDIRPPGADGWMQTADAAILDKP
ncbi:MAG: galactonate dehydratase [Planctomycetota bacterium]|jgi:galactonate dehydratase|nr:galactonate dehydratase [Planctomycetota bacterium]